MDWSTLASIGAVIQTVVLVIAAIYGYRQVREMAKARDLQATIELLDIIGSDEVTRARHATFNLLPLPPYLSEAEWSDIEKTSKAFNRAGWLLKHGLLDREMLFDMYCETIFNAWDKLRPYIVHARETRRFDRWQRHFEDLANEAREYSRCHSIADP